MALFLQLSRSTTSATTKSIVRKGFTASSYFSTTTTTKQQEEQHQKPKGQLHDSYQHILAETMQDTGVGLIQLNRPKAYNALSDGLLDDLIHATEAMDQDDNVGCMVLASTSGPKAFAAGADIMEMANASFGDMYTKNKFSQWGLIAQRSKPILCAVDGVALGGGCELALMCDVVYASETSLFGQPEINLGILPGAGGTQRLTRAIGKSKAMEYILTGKSFTAQQAMEWGLISRVVCVEEQPVLDVAMETAKLIASKGRVSTIMAKEAVNAAFEMNLQQGLQFERRLFHAAFSTEDQKEGMKAFVEKRPPNFTNK